MGARSHISKIEKKRFGHGKFKRLKGGAREVKMPSPPQKLTTQEAAPLRGEGLKLETEAPLRECTESLQAKYLINDSRQTRIKTHRLIHTHTYT